MRTDPTVSVIVATTGASAYLGRALETVAAQTYRHWELVVVHDGSADSDSVAAAAATVPGTVVVSQPRSGVSVARNVGIATTSGELCAFLDDDDEWTPQRLELQVAAMQRAPEAVLSYGRVSAIDGAGDVLVRGDQRPASGIHDIFRRANVPQFQSVTIRRRTLERIGGFHAGIALGEDLDLILRAAEEGPFVFVDRELARYRWHGCNATSDGKGLARSLDAILRLYQARPGSRDDETYADLRVGRRANRMYAAWRTANSVAEATRARRYRKALADSMWLMHFAPDAPMIYVWRRVVGRDSLRALLPIGAGFKRATGDLRGVISDARHRQHGAITIRQLPALARQWLSSRGRAGEAKSDISVGCRQYPSLPGIRPFRH